ncbi:hypothetical protein CVT24_005418 [Panaeolus cyanescens]|uniref:Uncharacterized protein n=1 Tax=Panaeolus cyanescens TaxID=181874 RepID=A0A409WVY0_9AGAR|nr:hypothetical protein CVT24_005418 [Panaeolus cyanescens]
MSAWTPIYIPLAAYCPLIEGIFLQAFEETQAIHPNLWRRSALAECKASFNLKIEALKASHPEQWEQELTSWITKSVAMDASLLPQSERLMISFDVSVLRKNDPEGAEHAATHYFSSGVQQRMVVNNIDGNGYNLHQHNILVDSTVDDLVEEIPNTLHISTKNPSESTASPPRKRIKEETPTPRYILALPPLTARGAHQWSKFVENNPLQWLQWCRAWCTTLSNAYSDCNNMELSNEQSEQYYREVVLCLRELRAIGQSVYQNSSWKSATIESDLAKALINWSNPLGIVVWKADFAVKLCRFHRIYDSFLYILQTWSGIQVEATKEKLQMPQKLSFEIIPVSNQQKNQYGNRLLEILKNNPDLIPVSSNPSSVFFLLSEANFREAVHSWLGGALAEKKLENAFLVDKDIHLTYSQLCKTLHEKAKKSDGFSSIKNLLIQTIFQRTTSILKLKKSLSTKFTISKIKVERGRFSKSCTNCVGLSRDKKCLQEIFVDVKEAAENVLQCGVSFHPRDKVNINLLAKDRDAHPLYHPTEDLNLKEIKADEDVIQRCGYQLYAIYDVADHDKRQMLDFYVYGAFSEDTLKRFMEHNDRIRKLKMKPLHRGSQFAEYSQGEMFAHGARSPMGGRAGDSYVFYDGMEGKTKEGLESLFDLAEDSMTLMEVTRVLNFDIFKDIKEAAQDCDRLGLQGVTAYHCYNYASPIHRDCDTSTGLCAQFQLAAEEHMREFSFIYMDYGIYFVPRRGSLW